MKTVLILILLVLAGWAWQAGWLAPARWQAAVTTPEVLYRWKDANGRWVYGTDVPPGRKAERVNAEDKMSVVSPPPAKPALPAPNPSSSDVRDLKAKLMDRTIEGQP